jgi:N-glycosylase/DNA lyase
MIQICENRVILTGEHAFSPERTFLCGQCFRFEACGDGWFSGIAGGRAVKAASFGDCTELVCRAGDFEGFWRDYFDLDRDYGQIAAAVRNDEFLMGCLEFGRGIRILRQQPWEALCSFIISQCNNIPRIKRIISTFCALFGEKTEFGHLFPAPEAIAGKSPDELAPLRAGYRAAYLVSAANAVVSGKLDLDRLKNRSIPTEKVRGELMALPGVGRKVADCVMLYGLGRTDAFPVDVWIKRALKCIYPNGFDAAAYGESAGIIQQYIYYYAREHGGIFKN